MRSVTIGKGDVAEVEWDENHFKFCEFRSTSIEGQAVRSDFVSCLFTNVDWYWGLFSGSNFIGCRFTDCVFAGCAFPQTRFIDCIFTNCRFTKDNLNASCDFSDTISYGSTLNGTEGFMSRP